MIVEVQENIFKTTADVIGHGCNCRGEFIGSIAEQIARIYPNVKNAYYNYHKNVTWTLSDIQLVGVDNGDRIIANCATQFNYLPKNKDNSNHHAIKRVLLKLKDFCKHNNKSLALPRIGCGLTGGKWDIHNFDIVHTNTIKQIYEEVFYDFDIIVYNI